MSENDINVSIDAQPEPEGSRSSHAIFTTNSIFKEMHSRRSPDPSSGGLSHGGAGAHKPFNHCSTAKEFLENNNTTKSAGSQCQQRRAMSTTTSDHVRVASDPTQPVTGSLLELHRSQHAFGEDSDTEESDDYFPASPTSGSRPRAFTCPMTKAFNRKLKSKLLNRPPTPTRHTSNHSPPVFDFRFTNIQTDVTHLVTSSCPLLEQDETAPEAV